MKIKLNLSTGLYEQKVFTLSDNENLQIEIENALNSTLTYFIKARIGDNFRQIIFRDKSVEIDRKDLTYGVLKAKVVALSNNVVVKEFKIEDLILQELDENIVAIPQVEQIKREFEEIKKKNEELENAMVEMKELCENTKELVIRLNGLTEKVGE